MFEPVSRENMPGRPNELAARDDGSALLLQLPFLSFDITFCIHNTLPGV
jgi:hypothetical protein